MSRIPYLLFVLLVLSADQLSKWFVTEILLRVVLEKPESQSLSFIEWFFHAPERLPYIEIKIFSFFNLVMVWNQGISFGLFAQDSAMGPLILSALSGIISLIFLIWLFRTPSKLQALSIALVISGAIGNLIDRLRFGAVIDFLDVHFVGYHWPAFNVADSAVCIGVTLLIISSLFFEKKSS